MAQDELPELAALDGWYGLCAFYWARRADNNGSVQQCGFDAVGDVLLVAPELLATRACQDWLTVQLDVEQRRMS